MIWTGMAMSPAVTSVFPFFVTSSGGYETARTIHFFTANLLVLFVLVHVAMVCLAGFVQRTRATITARGRGGQEPPRLGTFSRGNCDRGGRAPRPVRPG